MKRFFTHPNWVHVLVAAVLFGAAGLILMPDDAHTVIIFGVGIILLATGLGHVVRKLIFPYINGKELVEKVKENSIACAIVIVGLIYLSCTIITSLVSLLR